MYIFGVQFGGPCIKTMGQYQLADFAFVQAQVQTVQRKGSSRGT